MNSWRDVASVSAQGDLDGLLNVVLPVAEDLLSSNGEFYPFGALVSDQGETTLTGSAPEPQVDPGSDEVLAVLYKGARADAGKSRAAAFVADVRTEGSDAVRVELEHQEGVALVVLLPYTRSRFRKALQFGQMSLSPAEPRIWPSG